MNTEGDELYGYYQRELEYVRNAGRKFAHQHPETAARLELGEMESADPHVERLIESFAFLSGRVRRELDNESPEMAATLLETLLPNSSAPLPSMTVVQLQHATAKDQGKAGSEVKADTALHASARPSQSGQRVAGSPELACQFRTCYPVSLWPLTVTQAVFEDISRHPSLETQPDVVGVLRLSLACGSGVAFGAGTDCIAPDQLRFHLRDSWHNVGPLYDLLLCHVKRVQVVPAEACATAGQENEAQWREVGFGAEDKVLPVAAHAHPAYRQLQEYFAYPRKYLFFDACGLQPALRRLSPGKQRAGSADLLLLLTRRPPPAMVLRAEQFLLGCTPAINLFPRTSETLRLDQRQMEYRLVPDVRHDSTSEIHTILKLEGSYGDGHTAFPLSPYYDFGHMLQGQSGVQWVARRMPGRGIRAGGTDLLLSFIGLEGSVPIGRVPLVSAETLCTNRRLAEELRADAPGKFAFRAMSDAGVLLASCLYTPTRQVLPPLDGRQLWRLLSLLNLNLVTLEQLSDREDGSSVAMLRRLLELGNGADSVGGARQIAALRRFKCTSTARPVRSGLVPGFRRGLELELEFDSVQCTDGTTLMLAAVLQRFFQLYCSVNSFVAVKVMSGENMVKEWPFPTNAP